MRLWSIHPRHLDGKGLVALWREALLAKAVLAGNTRGYTNHPQLERFKKHRNPSGAINTYLAVVYEEASRRRYRFDQTKIGDLRTTTSISVTKNQLLFEKQHLKKKLEVRSAEDLDRIEGRIEPHPLFTVTHGRIESWERV